MNYEGLKLLTRLKEVATHQPFSWEDRETIVEIMEKLIEATFKDRDTVARETAVETANAEIVRQMRLFSENNNERPTR